MKKIILSITLMLSFVSPSLAAVNNKAADKKGKPEVTFAQRPSVNIKELGDPFKSYLTKLQRRKEDLLKTLRMQSHKRKRTPLELLPLSALRFSGVYRDAEHNLVAMLEDGEGRGYVAYGGDRIGTNNGFIASIDSETLVIVEKSIDKFGRLKDKVIDVHLDRSSGKKKNKLRNKRT